MSSWLSTKLDTIGASRPAVASEEDSNETQKLEDRVEPEHSDADRPRGLYGSWIPIHLNEAPALRRRCEFDGPNFLALQLVSGVTRSRPNRNFHFDNRHHADSAVRRGQLLALRAIAECKANSRRDFIAPS